MRSVYIFIKSSWKQFSEVGVDVTIDDQKKSDIRVTNQVALVCSILASAYFIYGVVFLSEIDHSSRLFFNLFHLAFGTCFIPVLLLNKYGRNKFSSLFLIIFGYLMVLTNSLTLGQPFRTEPYFFILAAFTFVVFGRWKIILPIFLLQAVTYYYVTLTTIWSNPSLEGIEGGLAFRTFVYFSLLFFVLFFLRHETKRYKMKVEQQAYNLSRERDSMEKLNFTKDKIFSIISHDLRSPIGSLKGLLSLLKDEHLTIEEFKEATSGLGKQVDQLHLSLDEMLIWSKAQLSGINPKPELVELRPMVQELFKINRPMAHDKKIIMTSIVPKGLEVFFDPNMLKSIISNLIANAIKFTPIGGAISIYTEEENHHLNICVEDTGVGIDKGDIDKVLSTTDHHTTFGTNNEKGTGLGLIMCKEFLEKNNGDLLLTSKKGVGSIFKIVINRNS